MSISKETIDGFCNVLERLSKELALKKTFDDLKSGGKEYKYNSLVFCVIDAVFSIGVKYESVKNTVNRYAKKYNLKIYNNDQVGFDTHKICDFIDKYKSNEKGEVLFEDIAKDVFQNSQRTSSTNGILKAKACYLVAKKLKDNNIESLSDFRKLISDNEKTNELEKQINDIQGQGSGIMFSYLCMLAGDNNMCKPDRWIKRFLEENKIVDGKETDDNIQDLFQKTCEKMKKKYTKLTSRYLDYQIWSYQRKKDIIMKHQYVADIGDYGKYSLLCAFANDGIKVGMNWYLVAKDETNDGKFIDYLFEKETKLDQYNSDVFSALKDIIEKYGNTRNIKHIQDSNIIPNAIYYSEQIKTDGTPSERKSKRAEWFNNSIPQLKNAELIFADPDNGLLVSDYSGKRGAEKYVLPNELKTYYLNGHNVVYYCHKGRRKDEAWTKYKKFMFEQEGITDAKPIILTYHKGTQRSYIFLIHEKDYDRYRKIVDEFMKTWSENGVFTEE